MAKKIQHMECMCVEGGVCMHAHTRKKKGRGKEQTRRTVIQENFTQRKKER